MTGKQIADILRKTRKKWGIRAYYQPLTHKYCVLGILATQHGINKRTLFQLHFHDVLFHNKFKNLSTLVWLNDTCNSKAELIHQLERAHPTTDWPIMEFVQAIQEWAKSRTRKAQQ
jgi:hypothetical protein